MRVQKLILELYNNKTDEIVTVAALVKEFATEENAGDFVVTRFMVVGGEERSDIVEDIEAPKGDGK